MKSLSQCSSQFVLPLQSHSHGHDRSHSLHSRYNVGYIVGYTIFSVLSSLAYSVVVVQTQYVHIPQPPHELCHLPPTPTLSPLAPPLSSKLTKQDSRPFSRACHPRRLSLIRAHNSRNPPMRAEALEIYRHRDGGFWIEVARRWASTRRTYHRARADFQSIAVALLIVL